MKIFEFAEIRFGPHIPKSNSGDIKYLNASHFDEHYNLTRFNNSYIDLKPGDNRLSHLLKYGEVIIAGKGYRFFAWSYDESQGKCITSSLFYVLTFKSKLVLPDFFTLQFNSKKIQKMLKVETAGASVPIINRRAILELDIKVPNIEKQKEIIAIWKTMSKEVALTEQLLDKKIIRNKFIINDILKEI